MIPSRSALVLLLTSACAAPSVDSPSAACRENPYYCERALLVDDAAEVGLVPKPTPPVPVPTPPPPTAAPTVGPGLVTKLVPLAPVVVASRDSKPPEADPNLPEVDAARKQPSKRKSVKEGASNAQPRPEAGGGQPPGEPPCIHIGTEGPGSFRPEKAPPGRIVCKYLCSGEQTELEVIGKSGADCEQQIHLSRAAKKAAQQVADRIRKGR